MLNRIAAAALTGSLLLGVAHADLLGDAEKETDQSVAIGAGFHENGGEGIALDLVYMHPMFSQVDAYARIARAIVDPCCDSTLFVVGIIPYPFDNGFYLEMGVGASKVGSASDEIFTAGAGWRWDLSTYYWTALGVHTDWTFDGSDRWSGVVSIGKRF